MSQHLIDGTIWMKITGIIWLRKVVDKLLWKHNVTTDEVEEVFSQPPRYRFIEKGDIDGEDLYAALGQTEAGRYLIIYFVRKTTGEALIISARDMTGKERRQYAKK
jgi:uncharacterized protein